jgi:predicted metal-dependent peptidase
MEELLSQIAGDWFLTEPLMFSVWCTHTLEANSKMCVSMRTGKMRIEYNPEILSSWTRSAIEERLRFEVIRILLGHPYQRQPYKAKKATLGVASDVTLTSSYHRIGTIKLPEGLQYEKGLCFEEYYAIVEAYLDKNLKSPKYEIEGLIDDGGGGASDDADTGGESGGESLPDESEDKQMSLDELEDALSSILNDDEDEEIDTGDSDDEELKEIAEGAEESAELWEEDQLAQEQIKDMVRRAQRSKQWGSIGGGLKDEIEATTIVRIDYRTILSGFRASVLSSKRRLTRMIPSRRYGFQYMGSKREFATRLLVAIDVSGSVDDQQVAQALSIINRFFKYGVENVDVIRFDVEVHGEPLSMKKARKSIQIEGRGGTDFQESIDYFLDNRYDGLIMITDGYAPVPTVPDHFYGNILWMLYNDFAFRGGHLDPDLEWITTFPKSKYSILPPV